jgi:hypothetical protein
VAALFTSESSADQAGFLEHVARPRLWRNLPTFIGCDVRLRGQESVELEAGSSGRGRM